MDNERVQVESRAEWRSWLERNHQRSEGVWLVTFKVHCGDKYVSHGEAIDEALCFGWIDSLPRKLDQERTMLRFAPRRAGSGWSKRNKERVEILIREGFMAPAGMERIETAKRDGSWTKLDKADALEVPPDLQAALDAYDSAGKYFAGFPRSAKCSILEWINNAKKPETRAKRIKETACMANEDIRANQ